MDNFHRHLKKIDYVRHRYLRLMSKLKNKENKKYLTEDKKEEYEDIIFSIDILIKKINNLNKNVSNSNEISKNNMKSTNDEHIVGDIRSNKVLKDFLPYMMVYYMVLNNINYPNNIL